MPLPSSTLKFTSELPYGLRLDVEGYVQSVDAARDAIYESAEVDPAAVPRDEFLFFAAVWRLWTQVDAQRWIVRNSMDLARDFGADGIRAGGFSYSRGSADVEEIRGLHQQFYRWLHRRGYDFVARTGGLRSLLYQLEALEANAG